MDRACIGCEGGVALERIFYNGDGTGIGMAARFTVECGLADRHGTGVGVQRGPIRQVGGCHHDGARVAAGVMSAMVRTWIVDCSYMTPYNLDVFHFALIILREKEQCVITQPGDERG